MFLILLLTSFTSAHAYLWWRLAHSPRWSPAVRWSVSLLLAAGYFTTVVGMFSRRLLDDPSDWLTFVAYLWMGIAFYLFVVQAAIDAMRTGFWGLGLFNRLARSVPGVPAEVGPARSTEPAADGIESESPRPLLDRRLFLARTAAVATGLGGTGVSMAGMRSARIEITTPEVVVKLPRLPKSLDGFRIALLTDLHIGPVLRGRFLRSVVELTNSLRPDLVAIGGDLVDAFPEQIAEEMQPLRDLRSRCGTYMALGNHEFYWDPHGWVRFLPSVGVRVLCNEIVKAGDGHPGGASFDFAGINDPTGGRRWSGLGREIEGGLAPDIERIRFGRDESRELVLLAHQPLQVADAVRAGAGLQLSGHTHGGQLWPFGALVQRAQPYIAGLHRHTSETQIYVSRGVGFWGPPMRVLAPAEVTTIALAST